MVVVFCYCYMYMYVYNSLSTNDTFMTRPCLSFLLYMVCSHFCTRPVRKSSADFSSIRGFNIRLKIYHIDLLLLIRAYAPHLVIYKLRAILGSRSDKYALRGICVSFALLFLSCNRNRAVLLLLRKG